AKDRGGGDRVHQQDGGGPRSRKPPPLSVSRSRWTMGNRLAKSSQEIRGQSPRNIACSRNQCPKTAATAKAPIEPRTRTTTISMSMTVSQVDPNHDRIIARFDPAVSARSHMPKK